MSTPLHLKKEIRRLYHESDLKFTHRQLVEKFGLSKGTICNILNDDSIDDIPDVDQEIIDQNVDLGQKLQKNQDINRLKNKSFRESSRRFNALEALSSNMIELLKEHSPIDKVMVHKNPNSPAVGVIQLSDVHFNECVDLPNNVYNFEVASKRIRKHVQKAIHYFNCIDISNVVFVMSGDMFNSDRRLDEILENATNRTKAVFLGYTIIRMALLELNQHFNVDVVGICGNEARVGKDLGWSQIIASENYDFMLLHMLEMGLKGSKGISVHIHEDPSECVIEVAGQNLLIVHGHSFANKKGDPMKYVTAAKSKYADMDIRIDYMIWGHVHEAHIGDEFARSGSTVGSNDYSFKGLNLGGRASQNLHVFYNDGSRDNMKIDLQNVDDLEGYPIDEELETYASSHSKNKVSVVIQSVLV